MSVDFDLYFEELPKTRKGGKGNKMPNNKSTTTTEAPKASRKYAKTRGEHLKDMVIVALVASIIAFIGGMHFQNSHDMQVVNASKTTQAVVAPAKK